MIVPGSRMTRSFLVGQSSGCVSVCRCVGVSCVGVSCVGLDAASSSYLSPTGNGPESWVDQEPSYRDYSTGITQLQSLLPAEIIVLVLTRTCTCICIVRKSEVLAAHCPSFRRSSIVIRCVFSVRLVSAWRWDGWSTSCTACD
jgi:hypothetical protein